MRPEPWDIAAERGLTDAVVIVTGAAGAIASAIGRACVTAGAAVVIADLDEAKADALACELGEGRALACGCDVTRPGDVDRLLELAVTAFGRLDVLVNAAGRIHEDGLTELPLATWRAVFAVNVEGPLLATQRALAAMAAQDPHPGLARRGMIMNVSSQAAEWPLPTGVAYGASKAALNYLTRVTAEVGAPDAISAVSLYPGMVYGGLWTQVNSQRAERAGRELASIAEEHLAEAVGGAFQEPEALAAIAVRVMVRPGLEFNDKTVWSDPHVS